MPYWDGTKWIPERSSRSDKREPPHRLRDWLATILMLIGLVVIVFPGLPSEAAGSQLTASPTAVRPGDLVRVSGNGFPNHMAIQLAWDGSVSLMPLLKVGGNGTFKSRVLVGDVAPGQHVITALGTPAGTGQRPSATAASAIVASVSVTVMAADSVGSVGASPSPVSQQSVVPAPTAVIPATPVPTVPPLPSLPPPPTVAPTVRPPSPTPAPAGPVLTFAAEFTSGLDAFAYDGQWGAGFGSQSDFMGGLSQVTVANGIATIVAERKSTPSGREWASAVMSTKGRFAQQYGYFEARIRYSAGNGLWPAFWMNPADGSWPPEIDIVEAYPNLTAWPGPTRIYSTLHYNSSNLSHEVIYNTGIDVSGAWHTYGLDWQPGSLAFYFDGQLTGRITQDVPSNPHYMILNLAVGNWSAQADLTTPNGSTMQIDYVRVYR